MIANTISKASARLGVSLAAGALAFTAFAGTGFAMSASHVGSFNTGQFHGMSLADICDDIDGFHLSDAMEDRLEALCDRVGDFNDEDCSCGNGLGSLNHHDCDNGNVGGFDDDDFEDLFGGVHSADVNANASTNVNNEINAGSVNDVSVNQGGGGFGVSNADIDANANTTVNNEINAASQNTVTVTQ